jgi:hypothetical protein
MSVGMNRRSREAAMPVSSFARKWYGVPSRIALLLGVGAISAAGANADTASIGQGGHPARIPQQSAKTFGELRVWSDNGRIYMSESGGRASELRLGDTAEARQLRELLERAKATADAPHTIQHRIILVGGGGEGFHWTPGGRSEASAPPAPGASTGTAAAGQDPARRPSPQNGGAPHKAGVLGDGKKG